MTVRQWLRYFLAPVVRPRRMVERLFLDPHKVGYAVLVYLFLGVIYTASVQAAYMRGFGAQVTPFLAIPAESYYFWQRFYQIPFFLLTNVLFAGTARLLALGFKGSGSFENAFALSAVAMTLPMFLTMWLPETVMFFTLSPDFAPQGSWGGAWSLFNILRQVTGVVWPLVIIVAGLRRSEGIGLLQAVVATILAFIPTGALMVVFIR